jgi:polar amino acid transport system substrate-binding protein
MGRGRPFALIVMLASTLAACAGPAAVPTTPAAPPTQAEPTDALATDEPTAAMTPEATGAATAEATEGATDSATVEPTEAATEAAESPVPTLSAECQKDGLALKNPPRLTLSTDIPAFPPWWGGDPATQYPNEPDDAPEWELSDPYSMEGYEGATAYAVAEALGFAPDEVDWVPNAVFEQAFAPGEKAFDFHLAQISIRPERAQAVDFSDSYLDANQAVLALTPNEISGATTIEDLKAFQLGAAANTTSFELIEDVIQPEQEPLVFSDNATALTALRNGQIAGLVVDVQTAIFMRDAELEDFETPDPEATVVGQFADTAQVDEVGLVLEKDSPLTPCVNQALAIIKADGTLDAIYEEWISTGQEIPFFE